MYQYMANQYKTNTYATSPQQLVVMCYDGMIMFLNKAKAAMAQSDIAEKTRYINKTLAIVAELQSNLNFEMGGEIAKNLDRIYDYFGRELLTASVRNDSGKIDAVINLMRELRTSWAKVANENSSLPDTSNGVLTTC
ncbi:MAG: flagellar export chaperone FliS [Acidobacteria bacterium]|nr:flagellar export chaperone FliS [Acidobacteriota bacterium]MCB9398913.1 flagellar export chaperone FliS [Acidobacteriota bacterium]